GLDSQRDRTAAVDVINGRPELELLGARGNSRKQNQRIGAVRFALPESAEPRLLDQRRQFHDSRYGIMGGRIQLDVVDHDRSSLSLANRRGRCRRAYPTSKRDSDLYLPAKGAAPPGSEGASAESP